MKPLSSFIKSLVYSLLVILVSLSVSDCQSQRADSEPTQKHRNASQKNHRSESNTEANQQTSGEIPAKVYKVLDYIRTNGRAPAGYVGGRRFGNFERLLPRQDVSGQRIQYQEWDVNPKKKGRNRGAERLVTGSDGRAWYTRDHYDSFVEVK